MKRIYLMFFIILLAFVLDACKETQSQEDINIIITEKVSYKENLQPIIYNRCLSCHGSVNPSANLSLDTYAKVKDATLNGNLIQRINDPYTPMPQSGLLPTIQRAYFSKWVEDSYPE